MITNARNLVTIKSCFQVNQSGEFSNVFGPPMMESNLVRAVEEDGLSHLVQQLQCPPPLSTTDPVMPETLAKVMEETGPLKDPYRARNFVYIGIVPEKKVPWKGINIRFNKNYCLSK